jgi:hypothetical protein
VIALATRLLFERFFFSGNQAITDHTLPGTQFLEILTMKKTPSISQGLTCWQCEWFKCEEADKIMPVSSGELYDSEIESQDDANMFFSEAPTVTESHSI